MSEPGSEVINSGDVIEEDYERQKDIDSSEATGNNADEDGGELGDQTQPNVEEPVTEDIAITDEEKLASEQDKNEENVPVRTTDNGPASENLKQTDLGTIVDDNENLTNPKSNELSIEDGEGVGLDTTLLGPGIDAEDGDNSQEASLTVDISANVRENSAVEFSSMEQSNSLKDNVDTKEELVQDDSEMVTSLADKMTSLILEEVLLQRNGGSDKVRTEDDNSFSPGDLPSDNKSKTVAGLHYANNNYESSTTEAVKPQDEEKHPTRENRSHEEERRTIRGEERNQESQENGDHLKMESFHCDANTLKEEFVEDVQVPEKQKAIFPQVTLTSPLTETVDFLQQQDVLRIFQELASGIVLERPSEPFQYMVKRLEDMKKKDKERAAKKKMNEKKRSSKSRQRKEEKYNA